MLPLQLSGSMPAPGLPDDDKHLHDLLGDGGNSLVVEEAFEDEGRRWQSIGTGRNEENV